MNASGKQSATTTSENITMQNATPELNNSTPGFNTAEPMIVPRPAIQETLHLSAHRDALVGPVKPAATKDVVNAPPIAARGDDDVMSQPQKQS